MVVLLTVGLWLVAFGANIFWAPKHTLVAYSEDNGRAKYVLWGLMLGTCITAFWAEPLTAWRLVGGAGLFAVGTAIAIKALHDNPFFRGDLVAPPFQITTGLYQYFDHPGYLGFALRFLGVSFIANNGMSVGLFFAYMLFLLFRADIENDLLADL